MLNTPSIRWICKSFVELSVDELYAILQARNDVFIVEQCCSYRDIDDKDKSSLHLMAFDGDQITAYARLLPSGLSFLEASIGRVLSTASYRRLGLGVELMERAIEQLHIQFGKQNIRIGAQLYLKGFYEQFGFVKVSDTYLEDNIPHIEMLLTV